MDRILAKEKELRNTHEAILQERDDILQSLGPSLPKASSAARSPRSPKYSQVFGNDRQYRQLIKDIQSRRRELKEAHEKDSDSIDRFNRLKSNYWTMVRNVFSVWEDEFKEYVARQKANGKL